MMTDYGASVPGAVILPPVSGKPSSTKEIGVSRLRLLLRSPARQNGCQQSSGSFEFYELKFIATSKTLFHRNHPKLPAQTGAIRSGTGDAEKYLPKGRTG